VAQLGARLDGIEEVVGSNPIGSTKKIWSAAVLLLLFRLHRHPDASDAAVVTHTSFLFAFSVRSVNYVTQPPAKMSSSAPKKLFAVS
jgi:hypothetical protein